MKPTIYVRGVILREYTIISPKLPITKGNLSLWVGPKWHALTLIIMKYPFLGTCFGSSSNQTAYMLDGNVATGSASGIHKS